MRKRKQRKKISIAEIQVRVAPAFKEKVREHAAAKQLGISAYTRLALDEKMEGK